MKGCSPWPWIQFRLGSLAALLLAAWSGRAGAEDEARNLAPGLITQAGHTSHVMSLDFDAGRKLLLTGSFDGTARLWEAETGAELREFNHPGLTVRHVLLLSGGTVVVTAAGTGRLTAWNAATGGILDSVDTQADCTSLCPGMEPDTVCMGAMDGRIFQWGYRTMRLKTIQPRAGSGRVQMLSSLPALRRLLAGYEDKHLELREAGKAAPLWDITLEAAPTEAALEPSGETAVVAMGDGRAAVVRMADGKADLPVQMHFRTTDAVAFSPDGRRVASVGGDPFVRVWSWPELRLRHTFVGPNPIGMNDVLFASDGVILTAADQRVRQWTLEAEDPQRDLPPPGSMRPSLGKSDVHGEIGGASSLFQELAFSPDGMCLLVGSEEGRLSLWDLRTGQCRGMPPAKSHFTSNLGFSPDRRHYFVGGNEKVVEVFATDGGEAKLTVDLPARELATVVWCGAGIALQGACWGDDKVWRWKAGDEAPVPGFQAGGNVLRLEWDATRKEVLAGTVSGLERRSLGGRLVSRREWAGVQARRLALDPSGGTVLLQSEDGRLLLWLSDSGNPRTLASGIEQNLVCEVSRQGTHLFSGSVITPARLWTRTGDKVAEVPLREPINCVGAAFSPDERFVCMALRDGSVTVRRTSDGEEACRLITYARGVWAVVTREGRFDAGDLDEVDGLHWVFPDDPFHALAPEIFLRDYYEPGLLPRLLAGEKLSPVQSLQNLNRARPRISIREIVPGTQPGTVDIEVGVEPATYKVNREGEDLEMKTDGYDLRLLRDGRLVAQWPGETEGGSVFERDASGQDLKRWQEQKQVRERTVRFSGVHLPQDGTSKVEFSAYAFNDSRVKSDTAKQVFPVPAGPASTRRAHLVCMGINAYESKALDLKFAAADAKEMARVLPPRLTRAGYAVDTTLLVSEHGQKSPRQATKQAFREALEKIATASRPADLVLISFSGHGFKDSRGEFYLVPLDIGAGYKAGEQPSPEFLARCVSEQEISLWMRRMDAGQMVLIVDACHSAAAIGQPGFKPGPLGSRGLGQLAYDKRMRVLAASQADEYAIEARGIQQGLLTFALVQAGLEQRLADSRPRDGAITLDEWLSFAAEHVPKLDAILRRGEKLTGGKAVALRKLAGGDFDVRPFVPLAPEEKDAKLPPFQRPQYFDYTRQGVQDVVLTR